MIQQQKLILLLALLMSFCSLCYEFLIATKLSHLLGEGIFIFPTYLSAFIVSMGLGSLSWRLFGTKKSPFQTLKWLLVIEIILVMLGMASVSLIDLQRAHIFSFLNPLLLGLILCLFIGFFTGQELPLLFNLCSPLKEGAILIRKMILADYLASFFASLLFTLLLFPLLGLLKISFLVSFLNGLIFIGLSFFGLRNFQLNLKIPAAISALLLMTFGYLALHSNQFERELLQRQYAYHPKDQLIHHFSTPYQQVLIFLGRQDHQPIPPDLTTIKESPNHYYLYGFLNGSIQFFNQLGSQTDPYHSILIEPFMELNPHVKNVLILGGGDGLPARQVKNYSQVKKVTMVDLDKKWVEFTKSNPIMKLNTQNALEDEKLTLHFGDAFKWVAKAKARFDAIFIDFPEGDNLAAVRTISLQFFRDLKRILSPAGVVVLQNDFQGSPPERIIHSAYLTAQKSGLYPLLGIKENSNILGHNIAQLALFKTEHARQRYLALYQKDVALKKAALSESDWSTLPFIKYQQFSPKAKYRPISFYDPSILHLNLKELLLAFRGAKHD